MLRFELDEVLKTKGKVFVLFYASWCPFSQRFLPVFNKYAQANPEKCLRVKIDDKEQLCEKYYVEYYPTVILFERGTVKKRLDATPGAGLEEKQLNKLVNDS